MSVSQDRFDELLQRASLASLFYYPEIDVDDSEYNLRNDVDYCLEPVAGLNGEDLDRLRAVVGHTITNPSAHRADLVALVIELSPEPAGE